MKIKINRFYVLLLATIIFTSIFLLSVIADESSVIADEGSVIADENEVLLESESFYEQVDGYSYIPIPIAAASDGQYLTVSAGSSGIIIDGLNARITNGQNSSVHASSKQSGRWYMEFQYVSLSGNTQFGVSSPGGSFYYTHLLQQWHWLLRGSSSWTNLVNQNLNLAGGMVIGMAVDADTGHIQVFRNGISVFNFTLPNHSPGIDWIVPYVSVGPTNGSFNVNFALYEQDFIHPIPEGFLPWLSHSEPPLIPSELSIALDVGEVVQLSVSNSLQDNTDLIWTSNDPDIAGVDAQGRVTGNSRGITEILVSNADGSYEEHISVVVFNSEFEPDPRLALHLNPGERRRLFLHPDLDQIQWTSMDTAVAAVDNQGRVTGVASGLAVIQATFEGDTHLIYVRVA